jgi:hypothetical protein
MGFQIKGFMFGLRTGFRLIKILMKVIISHNRVTFPICISMHSLRGNYATIDCILANVASDVK